MIPKIKLVKEGTCSITFSIQDLISEVECPPYQRSEVWTREQQESFIVSCIFGGTPMPTITILHATCDNIEASQCILIDGMQRYFALKRFINNEYAVLVNGHIVKFSDLPIRDQQKVQNHSMQVQCVKGNEKKGIEWIDNEQRRVSHTPGDYIYRHKQDRAIAAMTHDIVIAIKQHLDSIIDRSTCHGDYVYGRTEDLYPVIALILAVDLIGHNKRNLPTCWPDREGVLWLDKQEIRDIKYNSDKVTTFIEKIKNIKHKISLQTLPDIIIEKKKSTTYNRNEVLYCQALLGSGSRKGSRCGNKAKYHNTNKNQPCCGNHTGSKIEFV